MKLNTVRMFAAARLLGIATAASLVGGCAAHVDLVDVHGYHHQGYYDNNHDWHGGYYDENHQYHDDPHDWHQ
jgi:hypothetical protein